MYFCIYMFSIYTCSFLDLEQQFTVWLLPLLTSLKVISSCRVSVSSFLWTSPSLVPLPYEVYTEFILKCLSCPSFCSGHLMLQFAQDDKESGCNVWDLGLIPDLGQSSGEGNGYPLQYSCLENSMDRGAWWAILYGAAESGHDWATNTFTLFFLYEQHLFPLGELLHPPTPTWWF